jgi:hypothetical protein
VKFTAVVSVVVLRPDDTRSHAVKRWRFRSEVEELLRGQSATSMACVAVLPIVQPQYLSLELHPDLFYLVRTRNFTSNPSS